MMTEEQRVQQSWNDAHMLNPREFYYKTIVDFKAVLKQGIKEQIEKTKRDSSYSPSYKEAKINGLKLSLEIIDKTSSISTVNLKMNKVIIALLLITTCVTGCTENQRSRQFGGDQVINLPAGTRLVNVTWKQDDLWYVTEEMPEGYKPSNKTFHEDSSFGIWNGNVTFIETVK